MLEKLEKLKKKHNNNNLNFKILNKEKELLEDIFNYYFSEEALEFFKLAEKCELKEKLDNSSYKFIKNIHNKLKRLIDFYEKNRTFSLEIFYKPEQKFNENNLKEKTNNNKLWIEKIAEEKKENPNKIVFEEEEELSKKEALKKGITVTLNEHAQKLQKLNCKIHNNKKKMEECLDYYISKTFKKIVILLHKFANIYEFKDLFNLDVKSRIFTERKSLYDSLNILKEKEQKILNINNKILGFLAEKVKSSSNEFKFKKLHEIIKKIKEKQIYLDEIENFIKVLFKSNENEEDAKKPIEMKPLNLKDAQSYLEKNFENFKKTNKNNEYEEDENTFLDDYLKTYNLLINKLNIISSFIQDIKNIENEHNQDFIKLKKKNLKKLIEFCLSEYYEMNFILQNKIKEKNSLIRNYKKLNVKYLI